jgi:predicted small metal-binding protein
MILNNMTKKFACGDVVVGCGWSATANDESELFQKIAEHAKKDHHMSAVPDELIQKVRSKIRDV